MSTHKPDQPGQEPEEVDASKGYESTDVRVSGIVVFLTALAISSPWPECFRMALAR